jgi:putative hydrolase of the HAD superfamily
MKNNINTLLLDIGGVLLTNGWDRRARAEAVKKFNLEEEEIQERHHLTFTTYELGKLNLDTYLRRVIFYKERNFSQVDFIDFMFSVSKPFPDMIDFVKKLKHKYRLKVVAVSNEGRELNDYRINKFKLNEIFDAFVSSSYVHFRKPDEDIFKIALDISQANKDEVVYLDDRDMFVEIARELGLNGIHHLGLGETRKKLSEYGLKIP